MVFLGSQHLIDADEFGLHLNAANSKYGLAPWGMRIRKPGNYDRGSFKLTIILDVEVGDPATAPAEFGLESWRSQAPPLQLTAPS